MSIPQKCVYHSDLIFQAKPEKKCLSKIIQNELLDFMLENCMLWTLNFLLQTYSKKSLDSSLYHKSSVVDF